MTRLYRMARVYNHMVKANSIRVVCFLNYGPSSMEYKNAKQWEQRWTTAFIERIRKIGNPKIVARQPIKK